MQIKRMIRVLESVLAEKGNVEFVILDNDTDTLIEVARTGMTDDGRFAVYGNWSSAAPGGRIPDVLWDQADAVWDMDLGPGDMVKVLVVDGAEEVEPKGVNLDDLVWGEVTGGEIESVLLLDDGEGAEMVESGTPVEINGGLRLAGRGSVEFDAEGRIVRIVWDEEE